MSKMTGVERIATERKRQMEVEGWTAAHDRSYSDGTLASAGCAYAAMATSQLMNYNIDSPPFDWPFDAEWWKPSDDPIRNLEKAGALIAAEIDRLTGEA